ncbi:MAG: epoxyqueuosine reductase, partial [Candidatus Binatia bacterium]
MKRSPADNATRLSSQIKQAAQQLGFELVGISPVKPPPHEQSFAQWLRQGLAGELDYMKRTESLRRDPHELVPWALSIISVGLNYYKSPARPPMSSAAEGWISRYAWGDDYHDLMKSKLQRLLERVNEIADAPVQGRAFVDSGPVLERDFAGVAGLGWIGKNTHLISPKKGSWFFLGELFVDRPLV